MKKWFRHMRRSVLIGVVLVLLGSTGVYAAVSEVVKDLTGSATLIQAQALSDSSLGIYQDANATIPMTNVGFGDVTGFRYNIGQGSSITTVPVYIKNQSGGQLLVGMSSNFSQGTVELVGLLGGTLSVADRTLNANQVLPAKLKLTLANNFTAGSQTFTVSFIGQTLIGAAGPTFTALSSGSSAILEGVAWKPDGSYALIAGRDGSVLKYNGTSFTPMTPGVTTLNSVSWRSDGSEAIFAQNHVAVLTFDGIDFTNQETGITSRDMYDADWKPGGNYALVAGHGGTNLGYLVKLLYGTSFDVVNANGPRYTSVGWKPDGSVALIGNYDGASFSKYDGTNLTSVTATGGYAVLDVAYKPDGSYALMVGNGGFLQKYDGINVTSLTSGTTEALFGIGWKPDGSYALLVGGAGTVIKYDGTTFTPLTSGVDPSNELTSVSWKPDGSYALLVGRGGTVVKFTP